jgi:hypothetical protein
VEPVLAALLVVGIILVMLIAAGAAPSHLVRRNRRAEERAEALLQEVLSPCECAQLDRDGYLEVTSRAWPGRVYHVPTDTHPVLVLENGKALARLCLQSVQPLPGREVVLAHKILLEADEEGYWSRANVLTGAWWTALGDAV